MARAAEVELGEAAGAPAPDDDEVGGLVVGHPDDVAMMTSALLRHGPERVS